MLIVMSSMFRGYEVETNLQNYMRLYLQKPVMSFLIIIDYKRIKECGFKNLFHN
jgi:hypothetical protein